MAVVVITPPASLGASMLAETKTHLRVDHADDDTYITALIDAVAAMLEGPGGWLGRAFLTQTLEAREDVFSWGWQPHIYMPFPPHQSVVSIKYDDTNGTEQTLDPGQYRVIGLPNKPAIVPVWNMVWPTTRFQEEAVRVRYIAGYGANAAALPPQIKAAVNLMVGTLYDNRAEAAQGPAVQVLPAYEALLSPLRIFMPDRGPDLDARATAIRQGSAPSYY